jgi:hypothetical protein
METSMAFSFMRGRWWWSRCRRSVPKTERPGDWRLVARRKHLRQRPFYRQSGDEKLTRRCVVARRLLWRSFRGQGALVLRRLLFGVRLVDSKILSRIAASFCGACGHTKTSGRCARSVWRKNVRREGKLWRILTGIVTRVQQQRPIPMNKFVQPGSA